MLRPGGLPGLQYTTEFSAELSLVCKMWAAALNGLHDTHGRMITTALLEHIKMDRTQHEDNDS